ncbi:MAG: hypothetical protein GY698_08870 [Actinomycetia bacterium]|nr:hypothetical protein [Actinomycetes bacterium]
MLVRLWVVAALTLILAACTGSDSTSTAGPANAATEANNSVSPGTTARATTATAGAPSSMITVSTRGPSTTTRAEAAGPVEQVLADFLTDAGVAFVGPCADITPFSGTDLEVCSLEQRPAELADQIEIMVGPTRDWSGDPDGPFATDFGLPVEVAGYL